MGKIIYSNIQDKKTCVRYFEGKVYYASRGSIHVAHNKSVHRVIEHESGQQCITAIICDKKLYYFFNGYIDVIENGVVNTLKFDLRDVNVICIKDGIIYYTKDAYFIRSDLKGNVSGSVKIRNAVIPQTICIISFNLAIIGDSKGNLWVIDLNDKPNQFKLHLDSIQDMLLDGDTIVTVSRDRKVRRSRLDITKKKVIQQHTSEEFGHFINCITKYNEDYCIGLSDGTLLCLDQQFNIKFSTRIHSDAIRYIQTVGDSQVMTSSDDGIIYFTTPAKHKWRITNKIGEQLDKIQCSCQIGKMIYMGFQSGRVISLDCISMKIKIICTLTNVRSIRPINDRVLACGSENGNIYLILLSDCSFKIVSKRGATPYSMVYNNEHRELFVGRRDGTIDAYAVSHGAHYELTKLNSARVHLSIVGDIVDIGDCLFTCSDDQSIKILDYRLNTISSMLSTAQNTAINNLIVTQQYLLASSDNGSVYRILRENPDERSSFSMFDIPVRALLLTTDNMLYIGDRQGNILVWDFDKFAIGLYKGTSRVVNIFDFSGRIITVFEDMVVELDTEVEKVNKKEKVFIIHGHNNELKREVQLLLERIGIESIVLHEKPDKGRTIIDKLIEESEPAIYAIAILTPDDVVDAQYRARQNVYLETGYFLGRLGKSKVLLLKLGKIEIPNDLQGILYTEVDDVVDGYWKSKVVKELVSAGFNVDMSELIKFI